MVLPTDVDYRLPITQLAGEKWRLVVTGRRTDDRDRCELLLVADVGGSFALYPHGVDRFGVRLAEADARKVAQAILDGPDALDGTR